MNLQELNNELYNGPLKDILAPLIDVGADHQIADILNDPNGTSSGRIDVVYIDKDDFLEGLALGLQNIFLSTSTIKEKYAFLLQYIMAFTKSKLKLTDPSMQIFLTQIVTPDNILTQDQLDSIIKRQGSRAEVIWGADTIITAYAIGQAR